MSEPRQVQELTPPQAEEAVNREWSIASEDSRRLYIEMFGPGHKQTLLKSRPTGEKSAPPKPAPSVSREVVRGTVPPSRPLAFGKQPTSSTAEFAFRVFIILALAGLLCGGYVYTRRAQKASRDQTKVAGEASTPAPANAMVSAETTQGQEPISLNPTLSVVECEPGRSAKQTLTIANATTSELTFEMTAKDLVVRDGKAAFLPAGATLNGLAATAVFSEKYFNVKPRQTKVVSIEFTVHPQTAARGMLVLLQATDKITFGKTTMTPNLGAVITIEAPERTTADLGGVGANAPAGTVSFAISQWMSDAGASSLAGQQATPAVGGDGSAGRPDSTSGPGLGGQQP